MTHLIYDLDILTPQNLLIELGKIRYFLNANSENTVTLVGDKEQLQRLVAENFTVDTSQQDKVEVSEKEHRDIEAAVKDVLGNDSHVKFQKYEMMQEVSQQGVAATLELFPEGKERYVLCASDDKTSLFEYLYEGDVTDYLRYLSLSVDAGHQDTDQKEVQASVHDLKVDQNWLGSVDFTQLEDYMEKKQQRMASVRQIKVKRLPEEKPPRGATQLSLVSSPDTNYMLHVVDDRGLSLEEFQSAAENFVRLLEVDPGKKVKVSFVVADPENLARLSQVRVDGKQLMNSEALKGRMQILSVGAGVLQGQHLSSLTVGSHKEVSEIVFRDLPSKAQTKISSAHVLSEDNSFVADVMEKVTPVNANPVTVVGSRLRGSYMEALKEETASSFQELHVHMRGKEKELLVGAMDEKRGAMVEKLSENKRLKKTELDYNVQLELAESSMQAFSIGTGVLGAFTRIAEAAGLSFVPSAIDNAFIAGMVLLNGHRRMKRMDIATVNRMGKAFDALMVQALRNSANQGKPHEEVYEQVIGNIADLYTQIKDLWDESKKDQKLFAVGGTTTSLSAVINIIMPILVATGMVEERTAAVTSGTCIFALFSSGNLTFVKQSEESKRKELDASRLIETELQRGQADVEHFSLSQSRSGVFRLENEQKELHRETQEAVAESLRGNQDFEVKVEGKFLANPQADPEKGAENDPLMASQKKMVVLVDAKVREQFPDNDSSALDNFLEECKGRAEQVEVRYVGDPVDLNEYDSIALVSNDPAIIGDLVAAHHKKMVTVGVVGEATLGEGESLQDRKSASPTMTQLVVDRQGKVTKDFGEGEFFEALQQRREAVDLLTAHDILEFDSKYLTVDGFVRTAQQRFVSQNDYDINADWKKALLQDMKDFLSPRSKYKAHIPLSQKSARSDAQSNSMSIVNTLGAFVVGGLVIASGFSSKVGVASSIMGNAFQLIANSVQSIGKNRRLYTKFYNAMNDVAGKVMARAIKDGASFKEAHEKSMMAAGMFAIKFLNSLNASLDLAARQRNLGLGIQGTAIAAATGATLAKATMVGEGTVATTSAVAANATTVATTTATANTTAVAATAAEGLSPLVLSTTGILSSASLATAVGSYYILKHDLTIRGAVENFETEVAGELSLKVDFEKFYKEVDRYHRTTLDTEQGNRLTVGEVDLGQGIKEAKKMSASATSTENTVSLSTTESNKPEIKENSLSGFKEPLVKKKEGKLRNIDGTPKQETLRRGIRNN